MKLLLKLILSICFIFPFGCAHYGGGTVGTGLPLSSNINSAPAGNILYVNFGAKVVDNKGFVISHTKVRVTTSKLAEELSTNALGEFNVEVLGDSEEEVIIEVHHSNKVFKGSFYLPDYDIENANALLVLEVGDKIKVDSIDFY